MTKNNENIDIQALHMQNVAYMDIIASLKEEINKYDRMIRANEREIGLQLEEMNQDSGIKTDIMPDVGCTLCLGECDQTTGEN